MTGGSSPTSASGPRTTPRTSKRWNSRRGGPERPRGEALPAHAEARALKGLGVEDVGFETTDVAFDVWIDGDRFTQFAMDMAGDVPVSMTATLDDINEPVTIEAPKDWVEMPS